MEVIKKQRLAVCRILLDVVEGACEVRDPDLIMRTRHYPALQREMCFAEIYVLFYYFITKVRFGTSGNRVKRFRAFVFRDTVNR